MYTQDRLKPCESGTFFLREASDFSLPGKLGKQSPPLLWVDGRRPAVIKVPVRGKAFAASDARLTGDNVS
jgi:hypothetical protein